MDWIILAIGIVCVMAWEIRKDIKRQKREGSTGYDIDPN